MIITAIISIVSRFYSAIGTDIKTNSALFLKSQADSKFKVICERSVANEDQIIKYLKIYINFSLFIVALCILFLSVIVERDSIFMTPLKIEFIILLVTTAIILMTKSEFIKRTNAYFDFVYKRKFWVVLGAALLSIIKITVDSPGNNLYLLDGKELFEQYLFKVISYTAAGILAFYLVFYVIPYLLSRLFEKILKGIILMSFAHEDGLPLKHFLRLIGHIIWIYGIVLFLCCLYKFV